MGKDSPQAPATPDYLAAAREQGAQNLQAIRTQALMNRPSQFGPSGSTTWEQTGPDQWTSRQTLAPDVQAFRNQALGYGSQLLGQAGQAIAGLGAPVANLPAYREGPTAIGTAPNQALTNAMYAQATSRLDPQWAASQAAQEAKLRNQGINAGSAAYSNPAGTGAVDAFNRAKADAYQQAQLGATTAGQQLGLEESKNLFGQQAAGAQLQNALRQQLFSEAQSGRYAPIQALQGFLSPGLTSAFNASGLSPTGVPTPQVGAAAAPDIMGATQNLYNAQLGNYNAQVGQQNALYGGLGQLGSAALMAYMLG